MSIKEWELTICTRNPWTIKINYIASVGESHESKSKSTRSTVVQYYSSTSVRMYIVGNSTPYHFYHTVYFCLCPSDFCWNETHALMALGYYWTIVQSQLKVSRFTFTHQTLRFQWVLWIYQETATLQDQITNIRKRTHIILGVFAQYSYSEYFYRWYAYRWKTANRAIYWSTSI